jgi:hypothetical protein
MEAQKTSNSQRNPEQKRAMLDLPAMHLTRNYLSRFIGAQKPKVPKSHQSNE